MRKFKKNNIKLFFKLISPLIIFLAYLTLPYMLSDIAAKYCINKGAYLKAENIYWKSLSVRQKLDPMEPLAIIDDYRNLADLYIKEKKFDLAQFCFEQIIGLYEGEGHYDLTVDDLISLGSICWAKKDYKNTENYYLEAIKRAEKYFGKYDHRTYELELIVENFYKFRNDRKNQTIFKNKIALIKKIAQSKKRNKNFHKIISF